MLKPIYSFCQNTLSPIFKQKIPTDKIFAFFQKKTPSPIQSAWNRLPGFPSIKKIALIPVGLFTLYKISRWVQPYFYSITHQKKNETPNLQPNKPDTDGKRDDPGTPPVGEPLAQKKPENESDDEYISAEDGESELIPSLEVESIDDKAAVAPLVEKFKAALPGKHISWQADSNSVTFAEFLLQTIFRVEQITSVQLNEESQTFTLSYDSHKIVPVTKLPQFVWDTMPYPVQWIVAPFLKICPSAQISTSITVTLTKTDQQTEIAFDEKAFTLMPNKLGYTAHLKSIIVPHDHEDKLTFHSEHNARFKKVGRVMAQAFAEILQLNLQ